MKRDFSTLVEKKYQIKSPAAALGNSYISGLIGYARIARHFGDEAEARKAQAELNRLLEQRKTVEDGKPDPKTMYTGQYDRMCDELWRYLVGTSAQTMHARLAPNLEGRPNEPKVAALFCAWAPGPQESRHHEAYVSPPSMVMGMFQAEAFLYRMPPRQLRDECLDLPWTKADLYYIQKLALTLDLLGGANWNAIQP